MGAMARASCDCGYTTPLLLGGGMASFETVCLFPLYCRSCRALECANVFESPLVCPECKGVDVLAYDAPELADHNFHSAPDDVGEVDVLADDAPEPADEPGRREVFSWHVGDRIGRTLRLTNGRYLCPACQRMSLQFENTGCWD